MNLENGDPKVDEITRSVDHPPPDVEHHSNRKEGGVLAREAFPPTAGSQDESEGNGPRVCHGGLNRLPVVTFK